MHHKYTNRYIATCPNAYPYAHTHKYMYTDVSRYYIKISFERYLKLHGRQCQFSPYVSACSRQAKEDLGDLKSRAWEPKTPILTGH